MLDADVVNKNVQAPVFRVHGANHVPAPGGSGVSACLCQGFANACEKLANVADLTAWGFVTSASLWPQVTPKSLATCDVRSCSTSGLASPCMTTSAPAPCQAAKDAQANALRRPCDSAHVHDQIEKIGRQSWTGRQQSAMPGSWGTPVTRATLPFNMVPWRDGTRARPEVLARNRVHVFAFASCRARSSTARGLGQPPACLRAPQRTTMAACNGGSQWRSAVLGSAFRQVDTGYRPENRVSPGERGFPGDGPVMQHWALQVREGGVCVGSGAAAKVPARSSLPPLRCPKYC